MASNDVVLGAALRSNLLTLQNTQRSIDITQLRLATGKKVNSALDNPQSFFTAQSLSNRASDLTRLLDGIGQSIQTITEADKGVTALTALVEQADSIVSSARDELAASDGSARIVGNVDLRNITNLVGTGGIAAGDILNISTTNDAGAAVTQTVTITAGDSANTLAAKITANFANNSNSEITASIDSTTGYLSIQSKDGRAFKIGDGAALVAGTGLGQPGYDALGIGKYFTTEVRGAAANLYVNATIVGGTTASSTSLYKSTGAVVKAGDLLVGATYNNASGTAILSTLQANDTINFSVKTSSGTVTSGAVTLAATTSFQDVIDQVNQTAAVNGYIKAEFDSTTGQLKITSLSDAVQNVKLTFTAAATAFNRTFNLGLGDPTGLLDVPATAGSAQLIEKSIAFNSSTQALDQYASDFNTVRTQINDLVQDAEYRGVNLLNGDNLTTFFNEDNTNKLVTYGKTFTADGLGLVKANFSSSSAVETFSGLTKAALNTVRSFGSSLANNLSIIQARQTFTQETINTLKAGAGQLTDADSNEEGANLLALQTRQQLGVTALSLAAQSQQSVLRLF